MFPLFSNRPELRKRLLVALCALTFSFLIGLGILAQNGWLPSTDPLTGEKTGWFGKALPKNATRSWNPFAPPLPDPTPQLSKEYIYAGSRLLAVEDANANPAPPADLAVWRPTTGTWWVMGGQYSHSATQTWGLSSDKTAEGDYDGDGKTDFSVFRPTTGEWFVLQSSDGAWMSVTAWGNATDVLVPADYDGDGKTDRAVWRPSSGVWYIIRSSNGIAYYATYGLGGPVPDVPAPADYDGDGRADLAVWRDSENKFYSINSLNGMSASLSLGQPNSEPVSGDYDGDGKADYAIRQGATWIIYKSSTQLLDSQTPPNDLATDTAVQNDYDGDGKVDIAVWRNSNGHWYIRQSATNTLRDVQWGLPGDIPVAAFYRR